MSVIVILYLVLLSIVLVLHRYLSYFWEKGELPYLANFLLGVKVQYISVIVATCWSFGWMVGLIFSALTIFQITFSSLLWPLLLPWVWKTSRLSVFGVELLEFSRTAYGFWSLGYMTLFVLSIIIAFVVPYNSALETLLTALSDHNYVAKVKLGLIASGVIIGGNILRIFIMRIIQRY